MYVRWLSKNGQISIPKKVQNQLGIKEGDYLFVYLSKLNIVINKIHHNHTLNQCVFRNGKVSIPVELRKILNITCDYPLVMEILTDQHKILLKSVRLDRMQAKSIKIG